MFCQALAVVDAWVGRDADRLRAAAHLAQAAAKRRGLCSAVGRDSPSARAAVAVQPNEFVFQACLSAQEPLVTLLLVSSWATQAMDV
jgi:hypothetical protein